MTTTKPGQKMVTMTEAYDPEEFEPLAGIIDLSKDTEPIRRLMVAWVKAMGRSYQAREVKASPDYSIRTLANHALISYANRCKVGLHDEEEAQIKAFQSLTDQFASDARHAQEAESDEKV